MTFSGIMTTPMTPFDQHGKLALDLIEPFVEYQANNGISGLFCLGTWGGFAIQTIDERRQVAEAYSKAAKKHNLKLIVQTTCLSIHDTIELSKHAAGLGADAVASVVPMHYSADGYLGLEQYKRYFSSLVDNIDIPVHIYNNQRTTGVLLTPAQVIELVSIGVKGLKDGSKSAGWLVSFQDQLRQHNLSCEFLPGNSVTMIYAIPLGIKCVMSGTGVCLPKLAVDTFNALQSGDLETGTNLFRLFLKSSSIIETYGKAAVVSYNLLRAKNIDLGQPRAPWGNVAQSEIDGLVKKLRALEGFEEYL